MSRKIWTIFAWIQIVGIVASLIYPHTYTPSKLISGFGVFCWFVSFFIQMPGNIVSGWIIERFLWSGKLTLLQLSYLDLILVVIFNLLLWLLVAAFFGGARTIIRRARD